MNLSFANYSHKYFSISLNYVYYGPSSSSNTLTINWKSTPINTILVVNNLDIASLIESSTVTLGFTAACGGGPSLQVLENVQLCTSQPLPPTPSNSQGIVQNTNASNPLGISTGQLIGIVVGVIVVLFICLIVVIAFLKKE